MPKKVKIILSIVIPVSVVLAVAIGVFVHFYNFPTWTEDVQEMACAYLLEQEEIVREHGENASFSHSGMTYNTKTRNSVVRITVDGQLYLVTVDCVDGVFVVRGYEKGAS